MANDLKKKIRRFLRNKKFIKIKINLAYVMVALLGASLRYRVVGREQLERFHGREGFILNSWHGQQLMAFCFFRNCGYYILSSLSRDGEISSSIMRKFGWKIVRGSSSAGAVRGLIGLLKVLRGGAGVALTPDGPRGPMYHIEPGGIYLSKKSGAPLIPVVFLFNRKWISTKSWDQFVIPKPFSRCVVYFGEPIFVEAELTEEQLEVEKQRLQAGIHEANRLAEEVLQAWLKQE